MHSLSTSDLERLSINDMKRIFKKAFNSKKPFLVSESMHEPGAATSTSTLITSTTDDLMPPIPACDATARKQVTAGASVSL